MICYNLFIAFAAIFALTSAFPSGPGSCNSPVPVQGVHLLNNAEGDGDIDDFGLRIRVDGMLLDANSTFTTGVAHNLELFSDEGATFRGFLLKLYDPTGNFDAIEWLAPEAGDDNAASSALCAADLAGSVGHTNNAPKRNARGALEVPTAVSGLVLEATVVVTNSISTNSSEWYSSTFILNAINPTMPTSAPDPTDTPAPIADETPAPVAGSTPAPVVAGTPAPAEQETVAPTVVSTVATSNPTAVPQVSVTIVIKTDDAPEEIGWWLFDTKSGMLINQVEFGIYTTSGESVMTTVQVSEGGSYTLQMLDENANGICCSNGNGDVQVFLGDTADDETLLAFSRGVYGSQEFITFQASTDGTIIVSPSAAPSGPTTSPTASPSVSVAPSVSNAPSDTAVPVVVTISILTDQWPDEVSWSLIDSEGTVVEAAEVGFYTSQSSLELTTAVVIQGQEYSLGLFDANGDGICCEFGNGEVRVYLGFPDFSPLAYSDGTYGNGVTLTFIASEDGIIDVPPPAPTAAPSIAPVIQPTIVVDEETLKSSILSRSPNTDFSDPNSQWALEIVAADPYAEGLSNDRLVQRFALSKLWHGTAGGDLWGFFGWLGSYDECGWNSGNIFCNEFGLVVELDLFAEGLFGTIPLELSLLTDLLLLRLDDNSLTGTVPSEIGLLTKMDWFEIDQNILSGSIPTEIGSLDQATLVVLRQNAFTGTIPTEIGLMTQLIDLFLWENFLTGTVPTELGMLIQLFTLELAINELTGTIPEEVGRLTNLDYLSLFSNSLVGAVPEALCDFSVDIPVDCFEISCSCCRRTGFFGGDTGNCNDSPAPVFAPFSAPGIAPFSAPSFRLFNDDCFAALPVVEGFVDGTTETAAQDLGLPACDTSIDSGGVWYSVIGDGGRINVDTCSSFTNFDTKLTVFEGSCSSLECVVGNDDSACDGNQSRVSWLSVAGREYKILVHGWSFCVGDFRMNISFVGVVRDESPFFTPAPIAVTFPTLPTFPSAPAMAPSVFDANFFCSNAQELATTGSHTGTTAGAPIATSSRCGTSITSPGVWYSVIGTDGTMTATTCTAATLYDTKISVYSGDDCSSLECVDGNDDIGCSTAGGSKVSWMSTSGTIYKILVHGFGGAFGSFRLDITSE